MEKRFVKIGMSGQSVATIILKASAILESMTGNASFPTPNPDLAVYDAAIQELIALQTQIQSAGGGSDLTALRNTALDSVMGLTRQLAAYVDNVADGNGDVILSSGFELRSLPSPVGFLSPPELKVAFGEGREVQTGTLRAYHGGVKGRTGYIYRIRKVGDNGSSDNWITAENSARSYTFEGLTSAVKYELQMAVRSAAGLGGFGASVYRIPQ